MHPDIDQYFVDLRHPECGWQTVFVGGAISAAREYKLWKEMCPEYSLTLKRISGYQSWVIKAQHVGTHNYER